MSHDLQVIAKRQPRAADMAAFREAAEHALRLDGTFKRAASTVMHDHDGTIAEIDGPNRIEPEDLPDAANGAIGRSGWLVEISVKPSSGASWPQELAVHLARAADGVVYDPQQDAVTWPAGWQPRDRELGTEVIEQVELTWYVRRPSKAAELPKRILSVLAALCPEAMPKRYGDYEPYQHRFEGERAEDDFAAFWTAQQDSWTSSFSWTTTRPCFGGSAIVSSLRKYGPDSQSATVRLSLSFDGRTFARDPAFTERIVRLFTELAAEVGSFYAAAWVERGIILNRGRLSYQANTTEAGPMPRADAWVGLPASPTWLAWFGPPYADAVRSALTGHPASETDAGFFVRKGTEPMNADQLADLFPPLPARLLARRREQPGAWLPGARYSLVSGPPSQPAEEIPPLGDGT
ncbi:MAG TPA: hypothetical protein VK736_05875 [Candidatus Binatia bacterium]|nr:hypothetical protein [Candidatus Binatia bacterium]